ncbi:MAG: DUF1552 domain-containing protein [Myxococcota bacterium]
MFKRREFLTGLGLAAGASTLMPYLPWLEAGAKANGAFPKRLVIFITGNGTVYDQFLPDGGLTDFVIDRNDKLHQPLQPFRDKLTYVNGVSQPFYSRGPGANHAKLGIQLLTATELTDRNKSGGRSIDFEIANQLSSMPGAAPRPHLGLGVVKNGSWSWESAGVRATLEQDPSRAFDRVFDGFTAPTGAPAPTGPSAAELRQRRREEHFALAREQLNRIRNRLSMGDQQRIDGHIDSMHALQERLAAQVEAVETRATGSCTVPTLGSVPNATSASNYGTLMSLQMEVTAAALACDLTRVVTIGAGTSGNTGMTPSWAGVNSDWHQLGHDAEHHRNNARSRVFDIERYHADRFAEFLTQLDSIDEGGETLLDHSLVVWINPMREGNHSTDRLPILLAGGACGDLNTGRFLNVDATINEFWVSIARLMDVNLSSFGNSSFYNSPIGPLVERV